MSNQSVRKATLKDLSLIQNIARKTIDKCYRNFLGDEGVDWYINSGESDKELENNISNCYILEESSNILGFAIFFDDLIHLMMIDEKLHRSGLGSTLLSCVENKLNETGNANIKLETFEGNTQAINFYLKNGWVISKRNRP